MLVRQYRPAFDAELIEIPAGVRDVDGEDPPTTAQRELGEEVGLAGRRAAPLGQLYPSPGLTDAVTLLFLATDLRAGAAATPRARGGGDGDLHDAARRRGRRRRSRRDRRREDRHRPAARRPAAAADGRPDRCGAVPAPVDTGLPLAAEEFLVWLASERGRSATRSPRTAATSSPTGVVARRDAGRRFGDDGRRAGLRSPRGERRARRRRPSPVSSRRVRMLHRFLLAKVTAADDPTARLDGVRVPQGVPKPLAEARGRRAARLGRRRRSAVAARPVPARTAVRDRGPDLRAVRRLARRRRPRAGSCCGCTARARRNGSCPTAVPQRRPSTRGSRPPAVTRSSRALGPPRRRRGPLPQPPRRPPQPPGGLGGGQAARRPRRPATRAVATCAAPLLRHPPAGPRRRPAHRPGAARARVDQHDAALHPGVAGNGCSTCTATPIRAPACRRDPPRSVAHLARRFVGSFSAAPIDDAPARSALSPAEWPLAGPRCGGPRHSLAVARRLLAAHPEAPRPRSPAALLHDIGKLDAPIGTVRPGRRDGRPIGDRARRYRDHERLGAALLRSVGSDPQVVAIVAGEPSEARSRRRGRPTRYDLRDGPRH